MPRTERRSSLPTRCLAATPNSKTVRFLGRWINLSEIERVGGLNHGYVSNILQGKRKPSIDVYKQLATTLGMMDDNGDPDLNSLLRGIEERTAELEEQYRRRLA